jgi:hypothetical protein
MVPAESAAGLARAYLNSITGGERGPVQGHYFGCRRLSGRNLDCGRREGVTSHADDKRAFMLTDGGTIPLAKWLTLSAAQYSGAGITVKIGKTATQGNRVKKSVTRD